MKKFLIVVLSFLMLSPLTFWANNNNVSPESCEEICSDDPARDILGKVSRKFKALNSFQASFTLLMVNIDADINEKQQGKIFYKKDNKYRLETDEIIRFSNNTHVWTLFVEEEEVQINDFNPDDAELSPTRLFTIYDEEGFKSSLTKKETINGVVHYVIDLIPPKDKAYHKIRIFVDSSNYMITKGIVFEQSNTRYTYELDNFESNVKLNDKLFYFVNSDYEDYEVIDLTE